MPQIWIASHLNSIEGFKYLEFAIESCKENGIIPHLSISTDFNLNLLDIEFKNKCNLKIRKERKMQFEHIKLLLDEYIGDENELIIFLGDKDILLENALYYISENLNGYIAKGLKFHDFENSLKEDLSTGESISGSAIKIKHLRKFFQKHPPNEEAYVHLLEINLLIFIEDIGGIICDNPIVFRRFENEFEIYSELKRKTKIFIQQMNELKKMQREIINKIQELNIDEFGTNHPLINLIDKY